MNIQAKAMLAIVTVVIILTAPFINQPFNQDDRDFVEFARASAVVSRPHGFRRYLPFAILLTGGAIWLLVAYKVYGRFPALSYKIRGQAYQWSGSDDDYSLQLRPLLTTLGGTTIFPLSVLILFLRKKVDLVAGAVSLLLVGRSGFLYKSHGPSSDRLRHRGHSALSAISALSRPRAGRPARSCPLPFR